MKKQKLFYALGFVIILLYFIKYIYGYDKILGVPSNGFLPKFGINLIEEDYVQKIYDNYSFEKYYIQTQCITIGLIMVYKSEYELNTVPKQVWVCQVWDIISPDLAVLQLKFLEYSFTLMKDNILYYISSAFILIVYFYVIDRIHFFMA